MNNFDFSVDQGSTFRMTFTLKDDNGNVFDLSTFTADLMARKSYGNTKADIVATMLNGGLSVDQTTGVITLTLEPADTSSIKFTEKDADTLELVYDLEIVSTVTGEVFKPARGTITLNREVTRP